MFQRFQYVILPSLKANWLRSMPDQIWASNCATDRSAAIGEGWNGVSTHCHNVSTLCHNGSTLCLYSSAVGSVGSSDGIDDPVVKLFGTGSSDWGRISGVDRRDGVLMYVEFSEDVTTVASVKTRVLYLVSRWRIQWYVGVYQSRDEIESLCRPDLNSSARCIIPYIMARSLAPYIHVILADVVSITWYLISH